ncbi:MAG TPA: magnesium chelatase ATPase subunit I [Pyrinomonadaceae bacterium]|jgi:magnesium chelatase subunit D
MAARPAHNASAKRPAFPFTAIVGQEEMKLALLLNVVAPSVGGVLVTGHRGTGKTTAVRALAELLPPLEAARGCAYNCDPTDAGALCDGCAARLASGESLKGERRPAPVVELPLGATEDRVCGTIDFGRALREGVRSFEPGLLARANRGFLYVDEVNLLEDHLVDLLLDVAATGRNRVEREGVSAEHPARFRLVGSANPEEGELRPQLLDRFGLCVEVETERDLESRVLIVERREEFERDPAAFNSAHAGEQARLRRRVVRAASKAAGVKVPRELLRRIAEMCLRLGVDGHRGEITVVRAARALAALEGRGEASDSDVRRVAAMALRHRLRRDPLAQGGGGARVESVAEELFGGGGGSPETARDRGDARASSVDDGGGARVSSVDGGGERASSVDEGAAGGGRGEDGRGGSEEGRASRLVAADADGRGSPGEGGKEFVAPAAEVRLRPEAPASDGREARQPGSPSAAPARRRSGPRGSSFSARGRYAGATPTKTQGAGVALDATLRAAAVCLASAAARLPDAGACIERGVRVGAESLRFKRYRGRPGALFIFLVDASGSMASNRIAQAKGALAELLRRSYVSRDRVALVAFRESGAELLLAPSASASRARALLDALPVGGASPLPAGLLRALEVARRATAGGARFVRLVVFTDGRANVPLAGKSSGGDAVARRARVRREVRALGASLAAAGVASLVVDTQSRYTADGEGRFLAEALGGTYARLPQVLTEGSLAGSTAAGRGFDE